MRRRVIELDQGRGREATTDIPAVKIDSLLSERGPDRALFDDLDR